MSEAENTQEDVWGKYANQPAPQESVVFEELPAGAWIIGRTGTKENGRAAPEGRSFEGKQDHNRGVTYRVFNVGLFAVGGDGNLDVRIHRNRTGWYEAFLLPTTREQEWNKGPISGRFTSFLNAVYATGVGSEFEATKGDSKEAAKEKQEKRAAARWQATMGRLREESKKHPDCTLENYDGDFARLVAGLAAEAMAEKASLVLFKMRVNKKRDNRLEVADVEEYTEKNIAHRGVSLFPGEDGSNGLEY